MSSITIKRGKTVPDTRREPIKPVTHLVLLVAILGIAFINGKEATATLTTAFDPDLYRDIGQAYTIYHGQWLADPQLAGEQQWYNPLTAALIAGLSHLLDLDPSVTYVRAGAYIGLLAPLTFYLLLRILLDSTVALVGTTAFIFLSGADVQVPYPASYNPWLHSWNLAQVFFYLTLSFIYLFIRRGSTLLMSLVGLLWGVTFLTHFYPAILLGAICVTCCLLGKILFRHLLAMMGIAFIVGLPFTWSILFHYRMEVTNTLVVEWVFEDIKELIPYLRRYLSWQLPLAIAGAWVLVKSCRDTGAQLIGIWTLIVFASVLYTSSWHDFLELGIYLPPLTFSIHASFYFSAVLSTLFAIGAVSLLRYLASSENRDFRTEVAAVALILVLYLPNYGARASFTQWPVYAGYNQTFFRYTGFTDWIKKNTDPSQVFLAAPSQSLSMVVCHGRRVVAGLKLWSNPYVDMDKRIGDQEAMFAALEERNWRTFFELANRYEVDYLLTLGDSWEKSLVPGYFEASLAHPELRIYAVKRGEWQ